MNLRFVDNLKYTRNKVLKFGCIINRFSTK